MLHEQITPQEGETMSHHHGHEDHHQMVEKEIEKYQAAYDNFNRLFQGQTDVVLAEAELSEEQRAAFEAMLNVDANTVYVDCIDEGIATADGADGKRALQIGIGGAGVLMPATELAAFEEYLIGLVQQGKKVVIRSHIGCGAANLATEQTNDPNVYNAHAVSFAEQLTTRVNAKLPEPTVTHQTVKSEEMTRPAIHNAFGAIVETTGKFNPTRKLQDTVMDAVPPMFNVSDVYANVPHAVANTKVAIDIALGDHGLAEKFTAENPFVLALVQDSSDQESLTRTQEIKPQLQELVDSYAGRVVLKTIDVKGFAA